MSLWTHRDFMKLWTSQTVSEIGSRITREGLPMGAVLMMGVTPFTMSSLSLATQLPASLFGVFIGLWVDRLPRRPLLIGADILRAALLFLIPLAAVTGTLRLWMFFVVGALTGILSLLFDVAYQAYLPWLIDRRNLVEGNSKLSVTSSTAEVIGPGLTGMLVQALTAPIAIVFDALSYLFSAFMVSLIRTKEVGGVRGQINGNENPDQALAADWKRELREGFAVIRHNRTLLALAGVAGTVGFFSSAIFVLDTLYALKTLHLTAFLFGLTVTMGGIGSLLGAGLSRAVVRRYGVGRTLITMLIIRGLMAFTWVLAGGSVWRTMAFLLSWQLFGDLCGTIYGILDMTLRQTSVTDELLGRVNSTIRVAEVGLTAIGSLLSGLLGQVIGIRETMLFSAIGMTLAVIWLIASPMRHLQALPEY